ncbi:MAG: cell cycle histidine kinase CckA [Hyphomicrobiales bacterium]
MSETDSNSAVEQHLLENKSSAQSSRGQLAALALAVLVAAAAALFVFKFEGQAPAWLLGVGAFVGACGLFAILGWIAGLIHLGKPSGKIAFFEDALNALDNSVVVTDMRGRVVFANDAYKSFSGAVQKAQVSGVESLYAGYADISGQIYKLAQAGKGGLRAMEDVRIEPDDTMPGAHDSAVKWLSISVCPIKNTGKQTHVLWRIADKTAAKQAQEAAFSKLQDIITYLDTAPAGFFSASADGSIDYMNATLAEWLGRDLSEVMDGTLNLSDLLAEDGAKLLANASSGDESAVLDLKLSAQDGAPLPVRVLHAMDADADGSPGQSRSLVLRLGSAAANLGGAGAAEQRLARFFNNAPIGIAEIEESGKVTNANTAFATLAGRAVLEQQMDELVAQANREPLSEALTAAREGKSVPPADVVFGEGEDARTGQIFFSRIEDEDEGARALIYAVDTTEHKALELQFAQAQKMQAVGQLAGGVAHDFNNMLTAIIGFSDLLLAKHRPTDPSFQDIMNIKQNANRAANLVRQLLAFSRRQTLRPEVLSLTDTLGDLGNLLNRLLGEKIELDISHGRDLGLVKVDVNQFEQVIMNLAVNARDAMPDGGKLTIRTANISEEESVTVEPSLMGAGEYLLCEVTDTGVGMPKDVLDKIYEPFFSTKEVGKGTGLGLSTVYGIVKQTGGFIFCDSEPGEGATFRIYLPRHYPQAGEQEEDVEEHKDAKTADLTGEGTILLVEDEDAVRAFASRALQSRGYTVLEADSGVSALEQVNEHEDEIDLVISDVVMPEMDGPSLLRELRSRGMNVTIIFISGYAEDAFAKNLEENEKFAFLPKPFSLKQLAAAVKDAMAQ